jgi:3-deoxy-manno-octulosonate cytidylyltransferase (CMP-KDO synthetase)
MKQVVVIPARLNSQRFPKKILLDLKGLPMLEHVRRRVLLAQNVEEVYIATCDQEIKQTLEVFGAKVIMTSDQHKNGTTRVAEAVKNIECSEVILVQGDEPLLLPRHLDALIETIRNDKNSVAWNATGPIKDEGELIRHSFVKCAIHDHRILYCFRKSPSYNAFTFQKQYIRKILGLIAFRKDFLMELTQMDVTPIEQIESIEQMRIIEKGFSLSSIPFELSQPSINEPREVEDVWHYVAKNNEQKQLLETVLNMKMY